MLDLLLALLIMTAAVVVVLLAVAAVTAVPLVLTLNAAQRHGDDVHLWGGLVCGAALVGGVLAVVLRDTTGALSLAALGWVPLLVLVVRHPVRGRLGRSRAPAAE